MDSEIMTQECPWPQDLEYLVSVLRYKKGWEFELKQEDRGQGSKGLTLNIYVRTDNSYRDSKIRVWHLMPVPPASYDLETWQRWLLDQILLVESHEACEFFDIKGQRPYAPNHGPGRNPYTIFDKGTELNAATASSRY